MIPGIDVSHWQGQIEWSAVQKSGVKFAFMKATEFPDKRNTLFIDDKFKINVAGAKANGILWGAYHFFRTHIDPIIQAQMFCETVGVFESLPPVLDLEVAGLRGAKLNDKVKKFVSEVERISGRKPIIYTSGSFWRSYMCYEKKSDSDWARDYPVWLAQYTTLWPTPCYPWAGWDIWQYTDKGRIPGLQGAVDMNWFNGTLNDLHAKFLGNYAAKLADGKNQRQVGQQEKLTFYPPETSTQEPVGHTVIHGDYMEDSFIREALNIETLEQKYPEEEKSAFKPIHRKDIFEKIIHAQNVEKLSSSAKPVVTTENENWIVDFYKQRTEMEAGETNLS